MPNLDRLSSVISQFETHAERLAPGEAGNLGLVRDGPTLTALSVALREGPGPRPDGVAWLPLHLDIGGGENPLVQAWPPYVTVDLRAEATLAAIAALIDQETRAPRCGGAFALGRLCEVLLVSLLRHQIEAHHAQAGVFAGLAHPKLSRVLVAMHDDPGRYWRVEDFQTMAAMSRSQFMAAFQQVVGQTPMAYLKRWRMVLARNALRKGERVGRVAHRVGYKSSEAFCRAFADIYGMAPTKLVQQAG